MECRLHAMLGHRVMQLVPPALDAVSTVLTNEELIASMDAYICKWQPGELGHGVSTPSAARAGRMLIAQGAIDACKIGVTIAIRYGCARPQFNGKVVMSYLTHQRRLLPALATTYAMHLLGLRLKVRRPV